MPVDLDQLKDDIHELLIPRCEVDPVTGCWVYTGCWHGRDGHAVVKVGGRAIALARVAAWVYLGGFDLDDPDVRVTHDPLLCTTPACFNYEHLCVVRRAVAKPTARTARRAAVA